MSHNNKERHFCFVYAGIRMHAPDFNALHFNMVEGCSEDDGDRMIQYVRVSLHQKNGRRMGTIPRILDEYNRMNGRVEPIDPIILFPSIQNVPVVCFKSTAPIHSNPILSKILNAKNSAVGFWRWTSTGKTDVQIPETARHSGGKRVFITSLSDILRDMQLPESAVPVQRVYDELSEPYFRQFKEPLGEGTGCIPIEHKVFIISEIKRLFEEELSYIEQPSVGNLPVHAKALVDNAGWMGDILVSGEKAAGAVIQSIRADNEVTVRRVYIKTGHNQSARLERRGVGSSLREFFVFYALRWSESGLDSAYYSLKDLYSGWTNALESSAVFHSLVVGVGMPSCVAVEGLMLRVPSVENLLKLLCEEGLIIPLESSPKIPTKVQRMVVQVDSKPAAPILAYLRSMLRGGWAGEVSAEVTPVDVVRVLNGGDVGAYMQSCVAQFMRPFMFDGSIKGFCWKERGIRREKYVVDIARVALRVST